MPGRRLRASALAIACGALAGATVLGVLIGPVAVPPLEVLREVASHLPLLGIRSHLSEQDAAIVWQLRFPRVVLGALVGGSLALAGGAYQGVFRNPLADPYLLGSAAGAGLGATLAIAYFRGASILGIDVIPAFSFAGAAAGVAASYALGRAASARDPAALVLAGVAVVSFVTAIQTFVLQHETSSLREIYSWILGRLTTSGWGDVALVAPYVAIGSAIVIAHGRLLDVLRLGDDEARSLGVNLGRVRLVVIVAATAATAAVVSVSGLIGFVGLIVPHAVRRVFGTSYRVVLPLSLLGGAAFLVLCDILARTVLRPEELPIGVVTAFFGAPFFAIILRRSVRGR